MKHKLTIRLPDKEWIKLKRFQRSNHCPMSRVVRHLITEIEWDTDPDYRRKLWRKGDADHQWLKIIRLMRGEEL
jgi:hypothetical protein